MNTWRNGVGSANVRDPRKLHRRVMAALYPRRPDSQVTPLGSELWQPEPLEFTRDDVLTLVAAVVDIVTDGDERILFRTVNEVLTDQIKVKRAAGAIT